MNFKKYIIAVGLFLSFSFTPSIAYANQTQIECLAKNIYHEARGQSKDGQIAVANVVINRVNSSKFPNSVCAVINQRYRSTCQFSWVCSSNKAIREKGAWQRALELARRIYNDDVKDLTYGALFFRVGSFHKRMTVKIGSHIFYR